MQGFFSKKETASESMSNGKALTCASCGRYTESKNMRIQPTGELKKGILNILTMPDDAEDRRGQCWVGKAAQYIEQCYKELGVDVDRDCLNTYAVWCGGEKAPSDEQVTNHRRHITKLIKEYQPKVIVVFGDKALYSVIGHRWKKDFGTIDKWRGFQIPDQELKAFICPVFAPEVAMENKYKVDELYFKQDLKAAVEKASMKFPVYKDPEIIYLEDDLSVLDSITMGNIAFDYETTGIKPHAPGHRIVCASVAVSGEKVYTFMIPESKNKRKPFTDLLQRESVGKFAQNMKFEDTWTNVRFRIPVKGWRYDTMLAAHIIDNRPGVTGLKFQTFVHLGIVDYDSEVSPYLQSSGNNANELNRILELLTTEDNKRKLLTYCALDSVYEYRIAQLTRKHMLNTQGQSPISPLNSDFPNAYHLLHDGIIALAKAERQGLRIDTDYCEKKKARLTYQISMLEAKIYESKFYKHWAHTVRGKVNLNSGLQLGTFLYDVKKITPKSYTPSGKGSTDEEALMMLNIPELNWILERSKLQKIRDTYLEAFVREQVNGYLHPFFNLHIARTYRSSSSNPNFQNIPKRDETAMKTVRKAIYARPGHQLLEMDYSGIEVAIAACYHKDPTMIKYITDPTTDMHGDMAAQIFKIKNFDRKKYKSHGTLRQAAKNGFVFPEFYGDYYKNCAANICNVWVKLPNGKWDGTEGVVLDDGTPIAKHLMINGIKSYDDFESHIQVIEKDFWSRRFPVYDKWKQRHYNNYLKNGYVSLKTGFVCTGVMGKNDVINYPVQGAAFHCLLWTFINLTNAMEQSGMKSRLVGQIHDAIVLDVHPDELIDVFNLAQEIGVKRLTENYKWINVPLEIEAELCPVDGSWADKKGWKPE